MVDPPAQAGRKANTHSHPGTYYTPGPYTGTPAGTQAMKVKARELTSLTSEPYHIKPTQQWDVGRNSYRTSSIANDLGSLGQLIPAVIISPWSCGRLVQPCFSRLSGYPYPRRVV